jgi:hypothetical protein
MGLQRNNVQFLDPTLEVYLTDLYQNPSRVLYYMVCSSVDEREFGHEPTIWVHLHLRVHYNIELFFLWANESYSDTLKIN